MRNKTRRHARELLQDLRSKAVHGERSAVTDEEDRAVWIVTPTRAEVARPQERVVPSAERHEPIDHSGQRSPLRRIPQLAAAWNAPDLGAVAQPADTGAQSLDRVANRLLEIGKAALLHEGSREGRAIETLGHQGEDLGVINAGIQRQCPERLGALREWDALNKATD